ncbi:MAG: hypothetical protein JWO06_2393, partial [Bacteroidota bacterium]|nr:hypothetical protein [Bacteroidota bacterium]
VELKVRRKSVFLNSHIREPACPAGRFAHSLIILLCALSLSSSAQTPQQLFTTANQLYKTNQFEQAAASYEKILQQGYKNCEVYYNLGNCYYKLNNIGKSVLNYERALRLSPRDEDIQNNLKIANMNVIDKILPVPQLGIITWWNNFVCSNSSHGWGVYALVLVWITLVFFAVYLFTNFRKTSLTLGSVLLLLSFAFVTLGFRQSEKEQNSDAAILMISNSFVKSAPDANGNDLFMLHEGVKFQLLDRVGEWSKIRLADGKVGWLDKNTYEKI